jgi:uncharacterized protein
MQAPPPMPVESQGSGIREYFRGLKAKYGRLSLNRWFIAGEVVLVVAMNLFRIIEPFGTLAIGWASLWFRGMTWKDVGLTNPKSWRKTLLLSAGLTVVVLVFSLTVSNIVFQFTGEMPDTSVFDVVKGNYYVLAFLLLTVISLAGFPEELAYRAYFFNRLTDLFGGNWLGLILGALASSAIFGYEHFYEGMNAVISAGALALIFVAIYLLSKRNIWSVIIIHSAYDFLVLLAYFYS